jgi:hypothetical protein
LLGRSRKWLLLVFVCTRYRIRINSGNPDRIRCWVAVIERKLLNVWL